MIDPTDIELCAMDDAGGLGGGYLDEINKTDLKELSREEWNTFIRVICGGYVDSLTERQASINRAMQKITNIP